MSSIPIGTGHPAETNQRPKPLIGLDLPGVLNAAAALRKMVDQRPDLRRGIDPSIRTRLRELFLHLLGKPDCLGELVDQRDRSPVGQFLVAFGQRER